VDSRGSPGTPHPPVRPAMRSTSGASARPTDDTERTVRGGAGDSPGRRCASRERRFARCSRAPRAFIPVCHRSGSFHQAGRTCTRELTAMMDVALPFESRRLASCIVRTGWKQIVATCGARLRFSTHGGAFGDPAAAAATCRLPSPPPSTERRRSRSSRSHNVQQLLAERERSGSVPANFRGGRSDHPQRPAPME